MFVPAEVEASRKLPEKSVKQGSLCAFCQGWIQILRSSLGCEEHHDSPRHIPPGTENKHPAPPAIQVSFATAQVDLGN